MRTWKSASEIYWPKINSHLQYMNDKWNWPFFLLFRYLISKGKGVEARSALQWLRGPGIDISYELADMETANVLNKKNKFKFKELFSMAYFKPLAISMGLMFAQQFSGINAVMFYSVSIFRVMHMYFFNYWFYIWEVHWIQLPILTSQITIWLELLLANLILFNIS